MIKRDKVSTVAALKKAFKQHGVHITAKDIRKAFPTQSDVKAKQLSEIKRKSRERMVN